MDRNNSLSVVVVEPEPFTVLGDVFPDICHFAGASEAVKGRRGKEFLGEAVKKIVFCALYCGAVSLARFIDKGKHQSAAKRHLIFGLKVVLPSWDFVQLLGEASTMTRVESKRISSVVKSGFANSKGKKPRLFFLTLRHFIPPPPRAPACVF